MSTSDIVATGAMLLAWAGVVFAVAVRLLGYWRKRADDEYKAKQAAERDARMEALRTGRPYIPQPTPGRWR